MKVNRMEFLSLLKALSPAIANERNAVRELSHIWMDGIHISAFNDLLGIQIDFPTDFTGGVLGEKLIGIIERSQADTVDVNVDNDAMLLKIGRANIKLECRPIEDWFWKPQVPEEPGYAVTQKFREAVELLLISVGSSNVENPEQRGITVIQDKTGADLYSTDAVTLSWFRIDTGNKPVVVVGTRLIMPTVFTEQLIKLGEAELCFDENAVYCLTEIEPTGEKGNRYDMLVFSKLVADENPVSFTDVVNQHVTDYEGVAVPAALKAQIERAMVLLTEEPLNVEVKDNDLHLYAQTPYGTIDDHLELSHPNVKAKLDAALLNRALEGRELIVLSTEAVVLRGPGAFLHIVAAK